MKKLVFVFAAIALFGCAKEEAAPSPAGGSSAKAAPAGSTVPATAEAKPEAKPEAKAEAKPAAQKGLEAGNVIIGYLRNPKDEGQCAALVAPEAEKAKFDEAKIADLAKMLKLDAVKSCPSEGVVGVCDAMGMLVNYSGPKYTKESAQADCTKGRGKFIE
ncbi:hypothetical protein [Polyangium jinanense]|uniref:Lipoprotein n=1 Tax=Polyangium jinanense TaxID=2829994 RepID=A0A9X3XC93_9BACT|nr:hypothetical protein [Polyangium jinanense]MDC3960251.1 hypothetical protein [Polyangium jinanense]MDC3988029.1 hypothetical protein [Polyangium jinanense]